MKALKNLLKFTTFMIIFVFLLRFSSLTFIPNWNDKSGIERQLYTVRGFYEEEPNSLDLLFIGDSNLCNSMIPLELWDSYGITSYNFSIAAVRVYTQYYLMQDALRYQKPKLIIMDTATLFYDKEESEPLRRKSFDYMPLSKVKLEAINDPVFNNDSLEKLSYIFPIFRYHNRSNEITNFDVIKNYRNYKYYAKGHFYTNVIKPQDTNWEHMQPNNNENPKMPERYEKYLKLISEYCKENDIKLLLINLPDKKFWNYNTSQSMKEYAKKYDIELLDLNTDTYDFNWKTDMSDKEGIHANIYGAVKLTKEVGKYLDENYDLPDHRKEEKYKSWNTDLKIYNKKKETSYKKLEAFNENNNKKDKSKKYNQKTTKKPRTRYTY